VQILLVAIAGALGALARWGISALMPRLLPPTFPFGTLTANLAGCFILGVLTELAEQTHLISGEMCTIIGVGFIGALTTFSTFEFETFRLARRGDMLMAGTNFMINIIFCFLISFAGMLLVDLLFNLQH